MDMKRHQVREILQYHERFQQDMRIFIGDLEADQAALREPLTQVGTGREGSLVRISAARVRWCVFDRGMCARAPMCTHIQACGVCRTCLLQSCGAMRWIGDHVRNPHVEPHVGRWSHPAAHTPHSSNSSVSRVVSD